MAKKKAEVEETQGVDFEDGESLVVDLSGVEEDGGFEVLPKGVYDAAVETCEFKHSKTGNPMWALKMVVEDGDYAGRKLFTHLIFSEKMMGRTKKAIRTLGAADLLEGPFNPKSADVTEALVGKRCRIQVDISEYEGEKRNEIKNLRPAQGGTSGDGFDV